MRPILACLIFLAASASWPAAASPPDAWQAFRADVRQRCLQAGRRLGMKAPEVVVHPFGTASHGIAVLREGADKRICLYDKRTKAVELT
jgi:hypothetical protein